MQLTNDELLLEGLNVPVDPPPLEMMSSVHAAEEDNDDGEKESKQ